MIEYEVVDKEYLPEDDAWLIWLELTDGVDRYAIDTTIATEDKAEAQTFIETHLDELWAAAQRHQQRAELFLRVSTKRLTFAMELANFDEFNRIRGWLDKPLITKKQAWQAIKDKLKEIEEEW